MFVVDLKYLKKVGLYYDESVDFIRIRKNSFRYPTLSCKQDDEGEGFILVLSYFVSDDFNKQQIEFTIDEWQQFGMDMKKFETLKKSEFLRYFSITNTLVMNVYKSRLKGRKAWKKRNWQLPFRNAQVREAFGVEGGRKTNNDVGFSSIDNVALVEKIVECDEVMKNCVIKAARDFSYMPFDLYFEFYKKKLSLSKKIDSSISDKRKVRTNRDKVFKEFAKQVVALQKG